MCSTTHYPVSGSLNGGLGAGTMDGSSTINPAGLNSSASLSATSPPTSISPQSSLRGTKRSQSPLDSGDIQSIGGAEAQDENRPRKRGRPPMRQSQQTQPATAPVQTPQLKSATLPLTPPKSTPTKVTVIKALPTVRDHTTDQLNPEGDEYIPIEFDEAGEKKVAANGALLDGREYRCRIFFVQGRGDRLFMLATECARVLGYRDAYLLFNKNRSLFKIVATQLEKDDLISQEILPYSYRSRRIAIVTARSMFRQFGSRLIVNGRRVRDDYWESKARKRGFTEEDAAGEKRPGAAKAIETAAAEASFAALTAAPPHGEIIYSNNLTHLDSQHGIIDYINPPTLAPLSIIKFAPTYDLIPRDYSNVQRPRHEISGRPYQDRSQPSQLADEFCAQTLICEESARAHEVQMYEDRYGKEADPLAGTAPMPVPDNNVATSSKNDLKLYRGPRPSSETPMRRFVTLGPTQDTHPWLAKDTMEHLGISQGDLETASIRRFAAEFIAADDVSEVAEFDNPLNQQQTSRAKYLENYWKNPHEAAQQFPPQPHAQIPMAQSPMHAMHEAIRPDQMHPRSPGMGMNPTGSHGQPQAYGYPNQVWLPSQPQPLPLSQQHNMQQYGQPQPRNPYQQPLIGESSTRSEGPPSNTDGASREASSSSHMLPDKCDDLSSGNWEGLLDLIPDYIRWDLRFTTVFGYGPCWTCTPAEYVPIENIPLTIAGAPVVIPVKYHYPLRASVAPPPDPHPKFIWPGMSISDTLIEEIFSVYEEAIGFYLLVNGVLQIIVPEDFDLEYALSHRPNEFGGLKVSYIYQSLMPTGGTAEDTSTPSQPHNQGQPSTTLTVQSSYTLETSALGISGTQGPSGPIRALNPFELRIGSLVQAHVKGSKAKERFEAKLGLRTTSNNRFYLTLPTHIITQALTAAKSSSFPAGDWAEEVKIYSSNGNVEIGGIAETFDPEAGIFPVGFLHDTSLIEVSDASMTLASGVQSPLPLEWLSQAGWSNIKYQSRNLFLLDNLDLRAKSIGILDSQCVIVGQGIFKNKQNATRRFFRSRENDSSHDLGTWTSFISRSLLYRVNPEFRSPGAQSGTVVCFREELENGAIQGKVAGFSSFVQEVADTQRFEMDGPRLYSRLQEGRVAFYGAFQTPQKLSEHIIL